MGGKLCRMQNQREHFRLEYPPMERPLVLIDGKAYEILNLSEGGIKFACGSDYKPANSKFRAMVKFRDGKTCNIAGVILRLEHEHGTCVVRLSHGIPLPKMMEEQRLLIQKMKG